MGDRDGGIAVQQQHRHRLADDIAAAEDHGAPLYSDLAHRFCVRAYAADLVGPGARKALTRIVDIRNEL